MSIQRKIRRQGNVAEAVVGAEHRAWAERSYSRYGERAVALAMACRAQGLRDLVIPVENIPDCIPSLREKAQRTLHCQEGGFIRRCGDLAVVCLISDSGFVGFFCEEHGEKRAVRLSASAPAKS